MCSFLISIFKDIDGKIPQGNNDTNLIMQWKSQFGFCVTHHLSYRLAYCGTIFSLYQKDLIKREDLTTLVHIMYYEKFVRDDVVEDIFFSKVDLDKKIYLRNEFFLSIGKNSISV